MERSLNLSGTANYETVAMLAKAISGMYHLTILPAVDIDMVELAVVEIGNNAVEHAYPNQEDQQLWAKFEYSDAQVKITISDAGCPIPEEMANNLEGIEIPDIHPDDPSSWVTSGRGFGIINQIMDEIHYFQKDGKNHFQMTKHVNG